MPPSHEYPIAPTPVAEVVAATPPVEKKGWVHRHSYLTAALGTFFLIVLVVLIVAARSGVSGSDNANNWVGAGSVFFTGGRNLTQEDRMKAETAVKQQSPETQLGYIPLPTNAATAGGNDFGNDLTALLAQLTQPTKTSAGGGVDASVGSAFSFIPQGFISTNSSGKKLTRDQEALQAYGNELGTYIQGYESLHGNSAQMLKDQAEDRTNSDKAMQVKNLGYDMAALGRDMLQMTELPDSVKAAHQALATSYRIAGTNLTKIPDAKTDQEFLDAIAGYNESVESLSKRFFVMVGIFSANNVTFSSSDPGSIFMFNPNLSL